MPDIGRGLSCLPNGASEKLRGGTDTMSNQDDSHSVWFVRPLQEALKHKSFLHVLDFRSLVSFATGGRARRRYAEGPPTRYMVMPPPLGSSGRVSPANSLNNFRSGSPATLVVFACVKAARKLCSSARNFGRAWSCGHASQEASCVIRSSYFAWVVGTTIW